MREPLIKVYIKEDRTIRNSYDFGPFWGQRDRIHIWKDKG